MLRPCDHQTACISGPAERQTATDSPSSLGLKQTLWNVLMGRELILGLNLSGSSPTVPTQVYVPAQRRPSVPKTNSGDVDGCEVQRLLANTVKEEKKNEKKIQ